MQKALKEQNKVIGKKITSASVITNALKKVGTPFLYKPSRVLGAMATDGSLAAERDGHDRRPARRWPLVQKTSDRSTVTGRSGS